MNFFRLVGHIIFFGACSKYCDGNCGELKLKIKWYVHNVDDFVCLVTFMNT